MVDNTKKNAQAIDKVQKSQLAIVNKIQKELEADAKQLATLVRKKDYQNLAVVSERINKNANTLLK